MKILITGMTGFTGARLAKHILESTDWEIYSLERITSRPDQLGFSSPRIHRLYHDFRTELPERLLKILEGVDYIAHVGAEVHGLRSLENPELFVQTNVMGTFNILEVARHIRPKKFIYLSSAEAVGATSTESLEEDAVMKPSNPYAAAKAAKTKVYAGMDPRSIINTKNVQSVLDPTLSLENFEVSRYPFIIIGIRISGNNSNMNSVNFHIADSANCGFRKGRFASGSQDALMDFGCPVQGRNSSP